MCVSSGIVGLANAGNPLSKTLTKTCLKNHKRIFYTSSADDCPIKNYFDNDMSYSVKIYKNDDLDPEKEDRKYSVLLMWLRGFQIISRLGGGTQILSEFALSGDITLIRFN